METNLGLAVKQLYVESHESKDDYLCEAFVVYPEAKEIFGGYLIGLVEMRATPHQDANKLVQTMINAIKDKYYGQIKASPDPQKLNLETVFEYSLQKTNDTLTDLVQIGHLSFDIDNLNYIIAIAKPKPSTKEIELYFAHQGLVFANLIHKTKQNNFKVINVVDNTPTPRGTHDKVKIFSSILSGNVFFHDTIYFCTEIFNNYIPATKANKVFAANDLDSSVDYFKGVINTVKNNSYLSHAAIFLRLEEKKTMDQTPVSQKSIAKLMDTTDATEKFLTPTFALDLKSHIGKVTGMFKRPALTTVHKAGSSFAKLLAALPIRHTGSWSHAGSNKKKMIIAGIILAVALTGGTLFYFKHASDTKKALVAYQGQLKDIQTQINTAEAYYISGNEAQSQDMLKTAESKISGLPQQSSNEISNYNTIVDQIKSVRNRLQKLEKITPEFIVELPNDAMTIELYDNFALIGGSNSLNIINLTDRKVEKTSTNDYGDLFASTVDEKKIYFMSKTGKLLGYDSATQELKEKTFNIGNIAPVSFQVYNGKLYLIDKTTVYKSSAVEGGYSAPQKWLKDSETPDFSRASDLTIDGSIYLLSDNGSIIKYLSGAKQEFTAPTIEPAIASASKTYTEVELKYLYILDSATKRLILISKEGKLIKQYSLDALPDAISDFTVKDNIAYIIAKNKLYTAQLQ